MGIKEKILLAFSILLLGLGSLFILSTLNFGKMRIIACDVGQGDATLIVTAGGSQILVDGGPGKKVLECLGSYMPFWDRNVEMIVLTHPQKDHMEGLISVLENYKVGTVVWTGVKAEIGLFSEWIKGVDLESAKVIIPYAGQKLAIDDVSFDVLWPTRGKLDDWSDNAPKDLNESSVVLRMVANSDQENFCAYLTGDIPLRILEDIISKNCEILKVAHHGSKTGTSNLILEKIRPSIALIEAGKNNQYGHPHSQVLDLLISKGTKIYRTDTDGTVEITFDRGNFKIRRTN